jgi:hypothetical protein
MDDFSGIGRYAQRTLRNIGFSVTYLAIAMFANRNETLCFSIKIAFPRLADNILRFYQIKAAQSGSKFEVISKNAYFAGYVH